MAITDGSRDGLGGEDSRRPRAQRSATLGESFQALRGSGLHKRELRGKKNELEALKTRIKNDKLIQADNHGILANYDSIVSEQQGILNTASAALDRADTSKRSLESELKPVEAKLADIKEANRKALQPLQEAYDAAKRNLQDIESELGSARREYDSLERQLRRSGEQKRSTLELKFAAQKPLVENWEVQKSSAVNLKNQAEVELESKRSEFISVERPLEADIERLKGLIAVDKATIDEMTNKVDNATKRIDYSRHVRDNPSETQRLGDLIIKNEAYEAELSQTVKDLQNVHDSLKSESLKARVLIIIAAVVLVAIITLVVFLVLRANGVL